MDEARYPSAEEIGRLYTSLDSGGREELLSEMLSASTRGPGAMEYVLGVWMAERCVTEPVRRPPIEDDDRPDLAGPSGPFAPGALRLDGYEGFLTFETLWTQGHEAVPYQAGVYAVVRGTTERPVFLKWSVGGHLRGRDPSVLLTVLDDNWVPGAHVLYLGAAGGADSSMTLHERVGQLSAFGRGLRVDHWAGRLIWQVEGHEGFQVAWKVVEGREPRAVLQAELERFQSEFQRPPFANMPEGRLRRLFGSARG